MSRYAKDENGNWHLVAGQGRIDNTPTSGSNNAVSSGGVYSELSSINSALSNKEDKSTIKSATMSIGSTTVTFTQIPTTGNNLIKFYNDLGINYTNIDTSTSGQITLTFEAQSVVMNVYCEIKGVS